MKAVVMRKFLNIVVCLCTAWMLSGCDVVANTTLVPKIDDDLCQKVLEQAPSPLKESSRRFAGSASQRARFEGNYFKNEKGIKELGFSEKQGNLVFLNCLKIKYQKFSDAELERSMEEYGKDVSYPKNVGAQACDGGFVKELAYSQNRGSTPFLLMEAFCQKYKTEQAIAEINKIIIRGGDFMRMDCSIYELYQSDQPGKNLACMQRMDNFAENGFPGSGVFPALKTKAKKVNTPG